MEAHLIEPTLPDVAYVRMEDSPAPVRVPEACPTDDDIIAMANTYGVDSSPAGEVA